MADLSTVDPVAIALAWLRSHQATLDAWGGPDHISGVYRAPWPCLRLTDGPGGEIGRGRRAATFEVVLEAYGDEAGTISESEMRRLLMVAALALVELGETPTTSGAPVVSDAVISGVIGNAPLTSKQTKLTVSVELTVHPG